MKKRLYYHPKLNKYLVLTLVGDVVMEESEDAPIRRYLKCNYEMPSYWGFKFIGALK